MIQESAVSYLDTSGHTITESGNYQPSASTTVDSEPESTLPEPPVENIEPPIQESPNDSNNSECQTESESDWLSRMQA